MNSLEDTSERCKQFHPYDNVAENEMEDSTYNFTDFINTQHRDKIYSSVSEPEDTTK